MTSSEVGETDLSRLLAGMQPRLRDEPYVFCLLDGTEFVNLPFVPLGVFHEDEGITLIALQDAAAAHGLTCEQTWACITLTVHSSLAAVGFLAAVTQQLAQADISVNAVSAYYHDHLFVPWQSREHAMQVLEQLSRAASAPA